MKNRILITLIILIGLGALGVFIYEKEKTPLIIEEEKKTEEEKPEIKEEEKVFKETLLVKDDFEITLPAGWQEIIDFPEALLVAVDSREEMTNFSIKRDDIGKYSKISNTEEYIESVKTSLVQLIPIIKFTHGEQGIINGNNAFFIEVESTQEKIDFKTLLVFIEGENNSIWAISFNTLQNFWLTYKDLFYQTAKSFNFK